MTRRVWDEPHASVRCDWPDCDERYQDEAHAPREAPAGWWQYALGIHLCPAHAENRAVIQVAALVARRWADSDR